MPGFYAFTVEIDGQRYSGNWSFRQGGVLKVGSYWGSATVEIGMAEPVSAAQAALRQIVADYHQKQADWEKRQAREMAQYRRRRLAADKRLAAQLVEEPDPMAEVLQTLIEHIEGANYCDGQGRRLDDHEAFLAAIALLRADADA
jgi:hypothetical protein